MNGAGRALGRLCLLLFVPVFALCLGLPVYTDELVYKMIEARYLIDGSKLIYLFPQCAASFEASVPTLWVPVRLVDALLYGSLTDPLWLRAAGLISFAALLGFMVFAISRVGAAAPRSALVAVVGAASVGVFPFVLTLNRPEQLLFWTVALVTVLPFLDIRSALIRAALFGGLCLVAFSYHYKALYFLPIWLASAWAMFRTWRARGLAAGWLLVSAFTCWRFFSARNVCLESPVVQDRLNSQVLVPALLRSHPGAFFTGALENLANLPLYLTPVLFNESYDFDWLPPSPEPVGPVSTLVNLYVSVAALAVAVFVVVRAGGALKADWIARAPRARTLAMLSLLVSLGGLAVFQRSKYFYEAGLVLPVLALLLLLAWMPSRPGTGPPSVPAWLRLAACGLVCASQILLLWRFGPVAAASWTAGGGLARQYMSVSAFGAGAQNARSREAGARCGIRVGDAPRHLVLDDLTYYAFSGTYEPYHVFYVRFWAHEDDLGAFLARTGSDGLITQCKMLPESAASLVTRSRDLCCIPRPRRSD